MSDTPTPHDSQQAPVSWFSAPVTLIEPFALNAVRAAAITHIGFRLRGWGRLTIRAAHASEWPGMRRWLGAGIHDLGAEVPADTPLELTFANPFGRVRLQFQLAAAGRGLDRERLTPPTLLESLRPRVRGTQPSFENAARSVSPALSTHLRPRLLTRIRPNLHAIRRTLTLAVRPLTTTALRPRLGTTVRGPKPSLAVRPRQHSVGVPMPPIGEIVTPPTVPRATAPDRTEIEALRNHPHWTHHG